VRLIVRGRHDDAPVLHTVFTPLTIAKKLAGDRLRDDLRAAPAAVEGALETITRTMTRYANAALDAGADGLFVATQTATREALAAEALARFELPYTRRLVEAVAGRATLTLLHIHGREIAFDELAALPVHAINWHDRLTPPTLGAARRRFAVAATARVAQVFDLHALKAFAPDKRVRKMLFKTEQLWSEIACYEPGQSTVMHTHPREEEAIFVLEGTANMNIAGEEVVVPGGSVVKFPSNVPHDVRNLRNERCVIMFIKANPKILRGVSDG